MKVYRGKASFPNAVTVEADSGSPPSPLQPALAALGYSWGNTSPGDARLALAILTDVLGSEAEASRYHQRLKHRMVQTWPAEQDWTCTEDEVRLHIEDMRRIEREAAPMVRQMAREPAPVVMEGGAGIVWDRAER